MASDRQFLVQPLARARSGGVTIAARRVRWPHVQRGSAKVREAGTLPRSPRSSWRAATPEAPQDWPSGTDTMLVFAARARAHATLNRRLALSARIGERWC